jgi:hypothetical protein
MGIETPAMRKRNIKHFLARPQGRLDSTDTNMTFSMSRGTAARLKEIATVENTSLQQLVTVAVDEWLGRRSDVSDTKASPTRLQLITTLKTKLYI